MTVTDLIKKLYLSNYHGGYMLSEYNGYDYDHTLYTKAQYEALLELAKVKPDYNFKNGHIRIYDKYGGYHYNLTRDGKWTREITTTFTLELKDAQL